MKFALVLLVLVVGAAQADFKWNQLQHIRREMPVNPRYTWNEWQDILSNQEVKKERNIVYEGTEPQPDDAGVSRVNIHERIIGGNTATQGQFPWQAAIILDDVSFCGGSLISSTYILTAAHCTISYSTFTVTLGATYLSSSQSGTLTQVTRNKIQHEEFDFDTINNDIALLKLESAVSSTTYISPVRLPRSSQAGQDFISSTVVSSGWGQTNDTSEMSDTLNYVDLTVINNIDCALTFGNLINSLKICTTGVDGKSPCHGDSGGPLVFQESDGRYTEVGIVSFGSRDCLPSYPQVFTRVTSYLSWISSNTGIAINA